MRFSQDFIEKVREANNIAEIIGHHTELKGSGHRLMGRCPFPDHSDKSPSFSVTEDNQLYFCYGCKKGGNVFTFLETFNGMSFPEAIEYLARRASIPLPERDERTRRPGSVSSDQKDLLLKVNRTTAVFYHQQLKGEAEDSIAKKYLAKRGLTDEIVEKFRIGLSLEEWQGLANHLRARKVPLNLVETLGLVKPKKSQRPDDSHYDLFRDRLMFPIFSPSNDVIGFGGRTLGDAMPKYVNSSDSPVFNKSKVLYAIHETGKFIRAQDEAVVVEGYMDAISLYNAGIKNVVAILGTAFTPEHAKLLKRYTLNVKMLLDGDEAGIGGAERSLPILLEAGLMPKGFVLPDKMDPDDFVKERGVDQLKLEIERAPELFTLLLTKRWLQNYHGTASDKVRVVEEAANSLKAMTNRQLQDLYLLELARQLDVDIQWVRGALTKAQGPKPAPGSGVIGAPKLLKEMPDFVEQTPDEAWEALQNELDNQIDEKGVDRFVLKGAPKDEAFVLSLVLHREALMRELSEAGTNETLRVLSHEGVRLALTEAVRRFNENPQSFSVLAASIASRVDEPAVLACALPLIQNNAPDGADRKMLGDYLNAIRQRFLKNQARVLASQLREQASPERLEEFMSLQRDRLNSQSKD